MKDPHRARRLALQGLCCLDVQGIKSLDGIMAFIDDSDEEEQTLAAAAVLVRETWDDRQECDRLLTTHAKRWDLSRLAMVDRNILRLAVHELLTLKIPAGVVITEALRLAREFSTAESPRFINGVLDAVAKEIAKETS
jgi:transcription antitermination protein NusB